MKSIKTALFAAFILSLTTACTPSDALNALKGAVGVSTNEPMVAIDTDVGDKQATLGDSQTLYIDDVEGPVAIDTTNNKNSVDNAQNVTYNEFTPLTMSIMGVLVALALVGWAAPQISFRSPFWRKSNEN